MADHRIASFGSRSRRLRDAAAAPLHVLRCQPLLLQFAQIVSVAMFIPAIHAWSTGLREVGFIFFRSAIGCLLFTSLIGIALAGRARTSNPHRVLLTVVATYAVVPLLMALPVMQTLPDTGFFNAWWEMLSCLTTTGATLYAPDRVPPPVHLWRGMAGWMGGLFVLSAAIALMAPLRLGGFEIVGHGATPEDHAPITRAVNARVRTIGLPQQVPDAAARMWKWVRLIAPIYAALTAALCVLLMLTESAALPALMRAMGTLSTSGVTATSGVVGTEQGIMGEVFVAVFLLMALTRRGWPGGTDLEITRKLSRDPELRVATGLILAVTLVLISLPLLSAAGVIRPVAAPPAEAGIWGNIVRAIGVAWGAGFTALSYLTTTGWSSIEWEQARSWSGFAAPGLMLAGLALMGGGIATTAGGVKLLRVYALARHSQREMEKIILPTSVGGGGPMGRMLRKQGAYSAFIFFMLFAVSIAILIALVSLRPIPIETATILSVAALTNTGPLSEAIPLIPAFNGSAGIAGAPWSGWAGLAAETKFILALAMIAGRVEILAILALISPHNWRR